MQCWEKSQIGIITGIVIGVVFWVASLCLHITGLLDSQELLSWWYASYFVSWNVQWAFTAALRDSVSDRSGLCSLAKLH